MEPVIQKKKRQEDLLLEAKNFFNAYKKEIGSSIRSGEKIVYLQFNNIAEHSPDLSQALLETPQQTLAILENALDDSGLVKDPRVRLSDIPKSSLIKIREIRSKHLDQFLWIEGIVRQASDVRPQVVNAKFECPNCGALLSVLQIDSKFREPSRCTCGWKSAFRLLSKEMVDTQRLVIEESPDALDGGEQPRRINVFLQEDLVDPKMEERTTPGSKVKIFGVLKEVPLPLKTGAGVSTRYDIAVEANNIIPLEEAFEDLNITEEEEEEILELSVHKDVFKKLSASIAPSIYGFEMIKESVILQLFGGVKKKKSDGGSTRGDIHVLLVGDPGVAKSVLLKFTSTIAQKGRYVSGKAATAAGLTAAVIKDEFLRGWSLEAGAMVLSNRGVVCIDEIEKMNEQDRSTMHEAMEQQTVTVSKANIHASLRAETTVLAAGNPKQGRFNPFVPIPEQIDISPALLSRFDVIFVLKDIPNKVTDEAIASHVLEEHKQEVIRDIINPKLLRKYISYAKQKCKPKLTDEAIEEIKEFYVKLRGQSVNVDAPVKPIAITARQLEGIVRLSEAHAKMHLRKEVKREDARKAIDIVRISLMQVGYDQETKTFDIDKITTGISSGKRNKILVVREAISQLESKLGKLIPVEELEKAIDGKMTAIELEDSITQLSKSGDVFRPKKGFIQKT
ncbi:MAG: minichromosome maintenance protein MCM [archaeon]